MRAVIDGVYAAWADNDADEFVAGYAEAATATLPSGLGAPGDDPHAIPEVGDAADRWVQPIPDALVAPADPAEIVAARNGSLTLIVSLQHLPPRQRAVLILRDVLAFPAAEVARIFDTSTAAVKSSLQRARARLDELATEGDGHITEPTDVRAKALLDQCIAAFETADAVALEKLLRDDAVLEMPPTRTWFSGKATCLPYLTTYALLTPGDWRLVPVEANGQPAAAAYLRGPDGDYNAFGISLPTVTTTGIARITLFGDPGLFARFGCPPTLPAAT